MSEPASACSIASPACSTGSARSGKPRAERSLHRPAPRRWSIAATRSRIASPDATSVT
jgi:hypothetical protein